MREIKFRAWWNDTGKPVEDFNSEYIIDSCNEEVFTVEQFTGLHDKNGKEVYEGDVLSYYSGMVPKGTNPIVKQVVKWKRYQYVGINNWGMAEVIGNIHENPELLEANK